MPVRDAPPVAQVSTYSNGQTRSPREATTSIFSAGSFGLKLSGECSSHTRLIFSRKRPSTANGSRAVSGPRGREKFTAGTIMAPKEAMSVRLMKSAVLYPPRLAPIRPISGAPSPEQYQERAVQIVHVLAHALAGHRHIVRLEVYPPLQQRPGAPLPVEGRDEQRDVQSPLDRAASP